MTVVTRAGKGSPLTNAEMDANLTHLDTLAEGALPAAQKGAANGVAALNANGNLVNRQEGLTLANFRVGVQSSGSTGYRYATSGDLATYKHNTNETSQVYAQFKTARPNTSGTMLSLHFQGHKLGTTAGTTSLACTVELYVLASVNVINCAVSHKGDWRPPVLVGINTAGELAVLFDMNGGSSGAGFSMITLASMQAGHVGAVDGFGWMANWSTNALTDLASFTTAPATLPDYGPLPITGGTLTGPLQLPFGSLASPALLFGGPNAGVFSTGSNDVNVSTGGVGRLRVTGAEVRSMLPIGFSSGFTSASDVTLTRTAANALSVAASAGTSFSGPLTVGANNFTVSSQAGSGRLDHAPATGNAAVTISANPVDNTSQAFIAINRYASTSSTNNGLIILAADNTNTTEHRFTGAGTTGAVAIADLALRGGRVGIGGVNTAGKTLRVYGDTQIDGGLSLGSRTIATLPTAASSAGMTFDCTNAPGGRSNVTSDGTDWISAKTGLPVATLAFESGNIGNGTYGTWTARRYADGSMECTLRFIIQSSGFPAGTEVPLAAAPVNWPVTFTSVDRIHTNYVGGWSTYVYSSCSGQGSGLVTSTGGVYLKNIGGGNTGAFDGAVFLTAKGRWKA